MKKTSSSIEKRGDLEKMDETVESIITPRISTPTIRDLWEDFHELLLKGLLFESISSTIREPWKDFHHLLVKCLVFFKSSISELISSRPWKDLPHHLLELFLKPISEPIDRPNLSRVCKAWKDFKPSPSLCFPALGYGPTICNFIKGEVDECVENRICYGSCHGWLIIRIRKDRPKHSKDPESHRYYLLNMYTKDTIQLPIVWMCTVMPHICLSSPPTDPDCIAVLFDIAFQGFVFSKRGWNKWIKSDCKYPIYSPKPAAEKDYIYYVFLFQRKFYACTFRGNIVAIDIDVSSALLDFNSRAAAMTSLTVLPVKNRIFPPEEEEEEEEGGCKRIDSNWTFSPTLGYTQACYDWFLIESLGKLLAVRLYRREIYKEIINLDVLELDFKTMSWIKVKNLPGDQVLFISLFSSFSMSGSEIGGGDNNCIYVSDRTLGKIHKYDMHNQEMMVCTSYGYPPTVVRNSLEYTRLWVKPTFL